MMYYYRKKIVAGFVGFLLCFSAFAYGLFDTDNVQVTALPREAQVTLALIKQGGPFPYEKDGAVFGNYEARLPKKARGYYHEYTVKTPGARNRGAKRIIAGGNDQKKNDYFYTDDHYQSFRKIRE